MPVTPSLVDERSIFSYTPSTFSPSAEEIVSKNIDLQTIWNMSPEFGVPTEIHYTLPDGIKIQNRSHSNHESDYGLYATKFFKKHAVVLKEKFFPIRIESDNYKLIIHPDGTEHRIHSDTLRAQAGDYKLIINPDGTEYQMNEQQHVVRLTTNVGFLLSVSTFINHSCDPSGIATPAENSYEYFVTASRDIQPNDEITLDYCLTEYDDKDFIKQCYCQMPSCRGSYHGFRYLSDYEKEKLLPYAYVSVQMRHLMENSKIKQHQHDESEQHQFESHN